MRLTVLALLLLASCGGTGPAADGCWIHVRSYTQGGAFCERYRECEDDWLIPGEDDGEGGTTPDTCNMSEFFAEQGLPANNPIRECETSCPEQDEACGETCTDALNL